MTPVIGVTSIPRHVATGYAEVPHETAPENYLDLLARAAASGVVVPVHGTFQAELVNRLDGLLLTGGGDVGPELYGSEAEPGTADVDSRRDRAEIDLTRTALEFDLPVLGICRGHQVLNVALGGTLHQDLSRTAHSLEHWRTDQWGKPAHRVRLATDSRLAALLGEDIEVNSMHHQAIDKLGAGLQAVGWAPDDVVEAVEGTDARFCVGLQWHPECMREGTSIQPLVDAFVAAAKGAMTR